MDREFIGCLMYLAVVTRPDILFAVSKLVNKFVGWNKAHWKIARSVLRYISGTRSIGLVYGFGNDNIIGYTDADYACDKVSRKYTSGFAFVRAGGCFAWSSKIKNVVATLSQEAEYISQARTVRESLWVRKLISDFNMKISAVDISYRIGKGIENDRGYQPYWCR